MASQQDTHGKSDSDADMEWGGSGWEFGSELAVVELVVAGGWGARASLRHTVSNGSSGGGWGWRFVLFFEVTGIKSFRMGELEDKCVWEICGSLIWGIRKCYSFTHGYRSSKKLNWGKTKCQEKVNGSGTQGSRELKGLVSSINYDSRDDKKKRVTKGGTMLLNQWLWRFYLGTCGGWMMWRKESGLKVCLRSGRADIICLTYYLKKKKEFRAHH